MRSLLGIVILLVFLFHHFRYVLPSPSGLKSFYWKISYYPYGDSQVLYVCLSLAAFNICSWCLVFISFMNLCLGVFICTDHWGRLSYLFLLFFGNPAFKWVYLSSSPLPLASLLFSTICKASSDNHFAFLHYFFLGMVLITASCTISQTSFDSSSGILSIRSIP